VRGRASEEEQTVIEKWGGLLKELLQTANKVCEPTHVTGMARIGLRFMDHFH
jgi:hypothetical protein